MKSLPARLLSLLLVFLFAVPPDWATCGGGGGGGVGGMTSSSGGGGNNPMAEDPVYAVPWKMADPKNAPKDGLVLYWFPSSNEEVQRSSMRYSRLLSLYASQCVAMELAPVNSDAGQKLASGATLPVAVLATPDNTLVAKVENKDGKLRVENVEKALQEEMRRREDALNEHFKDGKDKAKAGDKDGAIKAFQIVVAQKCMFPDKAKNAAKELKKLGVEVGEIPAGPNMDRKFGAQIVAVMVQGLKAEYATNYIEAEKFYTQAHNMDPADPTPLRFLGELYRHHIGDWDRAQKTFEAILGMPADPLATAVALHGIGKMTIHNGDFKKGLGMMEESVNVYPLALAYRNLAVYWNSEGDQAKAGMYTRKAMELEPHDAYNMVFAAAFMAGTGHGDEALKIARENEAMLPASYNLAAIYAQMGQKDKALALLKRHFFEYERYEAVRSKEMMEARVDAVFASLRNDPQFMALTSGADGRLPMPAAKGMPARAAGSR